MEGLLLSLAVPLLVLGAMLLVFVADLVVGSGEGRGVGAVAVIALLAVLGLTFVVPVAGTAFHGAWSQDAFALYLQRIVITAGALGVLGSIDHTDRAFPGRQGEYHLMLIASLLGMVVLAGARELVLLVVAFELMGIPLYVLAAMQKDRAEGIEGAIKLYLTGAVSSVVTLYGLSFVLAATGTTNLPAIAAAVGAGTASGPMLALGLMLALAGMGFKIGAVPFHMWVPDTYQGAPTPFVAFLSVAPKAAGFAALVRLFVEGLGGMRHTWWPVLLLVSGVTMVAGNLLAVPQTNVKRLLAYSGIGHIGLMLLAFGIASVQSLGVLLFYLAAYVFTNMGAFFVVEAVGTDSLDGWRGLARRAPALSFAMLLFLLSLGGIPFVAGFWAKILLFWAAWEAGQGWMVLLGASLAVLALFYYMRVARSIYIEPGDEGARAPKVGRPTAFAIAACLLGVVGMGVWPRPFIDAAIAAAAGLLGG